MSQGSYHTARNLSDLGDDYRLLLEGSLSDHARQARPESEKHSNFVWTRLLSMTHFAVSGCLNSKQDDDLHEAQEEL
jgi:hypothetical protein